MDKDDDYDDQGEKSEIFKSENKSESNIKR